eukprot:g26541.t1
MRRYALKRYAELMRGQQESAEPGTNLQLQPHDRGPLGVHDSRRASERNSTGERYPDRRNVHRTANGPSSTDNNSPAETVRQRRNADRAIDPRYGRAVNSPGVDRSRFSERYSRNPEIPHSDYRLSPAGSFSPVQPRIAPLEPVGPGNLDRRASELERPDRRHRNGYVSQAQHETQTGDLKASIDDTTDSPESETPSDRLLLPQPEETLNRPQANAEVWDTSFLKLQRMTYVGTVIRGGRDDVGMDDILARFDFDVPRYDSMSMSSSFQATFLDGPTRTDLPPRLYNLSLGFQWDKSIKPGLGLQLGLTPAFYSDFENTGSDAFRIMARVIGFYTTSPQTQWLFGFAYLDREDVRALPVIGVIHAPRSDLRFDLIFPRPKISKRFSQTGRWERWGYISGEFGGGSWGIKRQNGTDDIATYSDWKLIFGFEQRYFNGRRLFLETGYVFNRDIEYRDGIVGDGLDPGYATDFAAALGTWANGGTVVVSRDGRATGTMLKHSVLAALTATGCRVVDADIASTPTCGVLVTHLNAAAGLQITASHNPVEWNGMKPFGPGGSVFDAAAGRQLLDILESRTFAWKRWNEVGTVEPLADAAAAHKERISKLINIEMIRDHRFRVVLDCNHGSGAVFGPKLLESLGCEVHVLGGTADGNFSHTPEPIEQNLKGLCESVKEHKAHVGFAQDPDADRLAIVDNNGRYIGEELTLALCADHVLATRKGPVVVNGSTSRVSADIAAKHGCEFHRSHVGEANVVARMAEVNAVLGGEGNGGVIEPQVGFVRDSFVSMAYVLEGLAQQNTGLAEWVDSLPKYTIVKDKITCPREKVEGACSALRAAYTDATPTEGDGLRLDWPDRWVQVRASNTEPIIRIIAEAPDESLARDLCRDAVALVETSL